MFPNCLAWLHISIRLQIKCREPTPKNEDVGTIATLDTLADHFKFHGAQKTAGKDPAASGGSLKIGVKDTSPFSGSLLTSSNVTGVFVEVWVLRLGQSVYFILMCLKPMDNGTVSVVVIGFGPAESGVIDFEFPISFNITITP